MAALCRITDLGVRRSEGPHSTQSVISSHLQPTSIIPLSWPHIISSTEFDNFVSSGVLSHKASHFLAPKAKTRCPLMTVA